MVELHLSSTDFAVHLESTPQLSRLSGSSMVPFKLTTRSLHPKTNHSQLLKSKPSRLRSLPLVKLSLVLQSLMLVEMENRLLQMVWSKQQPSHQRFLFQLLPTKVILSSLNGSSHSSGKQLRYLPSKFQPTLSTTVFMEVLLGSGESFHTKSRILPNKSNWTKLMKNTCQTSFLLRVRRKMMVVFKLLVTMVTWVDCDDY